MKRKLAGASVCLVIACGGVDPIGDASDGGSQSDDGGGNAVATDGGKTDNGDASVSNDALAGGVDGTPTRIACTNTLSSTLVGNYGRLDGFLIAIVPPGSASCNGDPTHLHLQIRANGDIYDVAVPVTFIQDGGAGQIFMDEKDAPLVGGAWNEGWHTAGISLDYVAQFNAHSADFQQLDPSDATSRIDTVIQNANHVSIYGVVYASKDGLNRIFRAEAAQDGALATQPLSPNAHYVLLRQATQSF